MAVIGFILSPFIFIGKLLTGDASDKPTPLNLFVGIAFVGGIVILIHIIVKNIKKSAIQDQINANQRELQDFIEGGEILEPQPVDVSLEVNEQAYYTERRVPLGQAKTVHKRDGAGIGFRVFKGVGVGSYHSEGRTYSKLRHCDRGGLILTNRNLIFRGIAEQRVIPLNKILYIEEFNDAIQVSQRNRKSMDYFFVRNPYMWGYLIKKMQNGELLVNNVNRRRQTRVASVERVPSASRFLPPPVDPDNNSDDSSDTPPSSDSPSGSTYYFNRSQPTSTVEQIFMGSYYQLAMEIIRRSDLTTVARKTGYVNLYNGKACAQLHPHNQGVALVIPELDQRCPPCTLLRQIPIQSLQGYQGTNKSWLDGDGTRWTYSPAGAFLVPADMENQPKHPGWKEVDALLAYIKSR
jgi:hypothetical protein